MNTIIIDSVDYSKYAVYPLKIRYLLDKSLDQATLTLKNLSQEIPFEPLSKVVIDDEFTFLISNDNVKRSVYGGQIRYTHDLLLIEETKLLEKYFVDTCTFTNKLINEPDMTPRYVEASVMAVDDMNKYWEEYKDKTGTDTPWETGYSPEIDTDLMGTTNNQFYQSPLVYTPGFTTINLTMAKAYYSSNNNTVTTSGNVYMAYRLYDADYNLISSNMAQELGEVSKTVTSIGTYYAEFVCLQSYYAGILGRRYDCYGIRFAISVVSSAISIQDITITDVVNRLLAITETQRIGETPRFSFNGTQATKYSTVLAPEFAITKSTLREALQQVGGYIHAEPRLVGNVIYFDDLGRREYATIPANYVSYTTTQDIEQFCSEIDSNVDNLVNIDDEQGGTIVEPFSNGYKTTRVEVGTVDITDSTAFIETTKPIEKIVKVEFGYLSDDTWVGDITPYIYESSEYSVLDSYDGVYPYSKAWALYYTQGQRNIYGLNFEKPDAISPYFQKFAIINIIERVKNIIVDASTNPLSKMQFRVTYIPVISARIKQHKPYLQATKQKSVLAYNASANKVDTDYYGENLKGAVARLGNIDKTITYCTKELTNIPNAGMLFDRDYYISVVSIEFLPTYYRFTLGLSKDFNRWNEYVGINNNQRFYEVSEKQSVERYTIFEDYLIIGDNVDIETNDYEKSIVDTGIFYTLIQNLIPGQNGRAKAVTCIAFSGYDSNNNAISTVTMPAISFALGNSVIYQISMDNSFGAGTMVQGFSNAKGFQTQKQYGDIFGNVETVKIEGYATPYREDIIVIHPSEYEARIEEGASVPAITPTNTIKEFSTGNANIILKKDSRENINFAYQIHCVTNKDNIVIGSGLAKKLATKNVPYANAEYGDIYIMDREITKFEKEITDLPNISESISYSITSSTATKKILIDTITCNKAGKSVIIVDRDTKELLFAINEEVSNGQTYTMPSMMFRHKIYN